MLGCNDVAPPSRSICCQALEDCAVTCLDSKATVAGACTNDRFVTANPLREALGWPVPLDTCCRTNSWHAFISVGRKLDLCCDPGSMEFTLTTKDVVTLLSEHLNVPATMFPAENHHAIFLSTHLNCILVAAV